VAVTLAAPNKGILCPAKVLDLSSRGVVVQIDPSTWRPLARVVVFFIPPDPKPLSGSCNHARVTRDGVGLRGWEERLRPGLS